MLNALRDRTAANAVLLVRICRGTACDVSSVAPTQSAWQHSGLRSLQVAARVCSEHGSPIASPAVARHTSTSPTPASPCEAGGRMQPSSPFSAAPSAGRGVNPSLSRLPFYAAQFQRSFQSSAAHSAAAAAAVAEPTDAATDSDTAALEDAVVQPRAPHGVASAPWTPTDQLQKRKTLPKRMGFMLQVSYPPITLCCLRCIQRLCDKILVATS